MNVEARPTVWNWPPRTRTIVVFAIGHHEEDDDLNATP